MKSIIYLFSILFFLFFSCKNNKRPIETNRFNFERDLLLLQYDCKTDVDDLLSVAACATLLTHPDYSKINYHAVAGTYGTQEGLYVPSNELFNLAFGDNWSDAHNDHNSAIERVKNRVIATLQNKGDVWIAEAGQSDFSSEIVKTIQADFPDNDFAKHFHIVQHSDWNEEVTSPEKLSFLKQNIDYQKIPDGNVPGNGTPGFRSMVKIDWKRKLKSPRLIEAWQVSTGLANRYNGSEGRYLNEAIQAGGLDFSDFVEVWWILSLPEIKDSQHFFDLYAN